MLSLIILIILIIIGTFLVIKFDGFIDGNEFLYLTGGIINIFSIPFLILAILGVLLKPIFYKNFKIKYETLKYTETSSIDIRDTNYTQKIIEINETIRSHREYINSKWFGIFHSKDIANMEYLNKEIGDE